MDALRPAELPQSSSPCAHDHVRTGKQYIKSMEVFGESAVCYSGISELPLHYKERMLYLTACRGFPVLDVPFPLDFLVGVRYFDAAGTDIGSEFHLRKMFVRFYLRTAIPLYPESPYMTSSSSRISFVASSMSCTLADVAVIVWT